MVCINIILLFLDPQIKPNKTLIKKIKQISNVGKLIMNQFLYNSEYENKNIKSPLVITNFTKIIAYFQL